MKLASFDLEVARIPQGDDWHNLGISCAVCVFSDRDEAIVWQGVPELGRFGSWGAINALEQIASAGYRLITFNGAGFDFNVMADECTPMALTAKYLARTHIDLFFHLFCILGYAPGLNALANGMALGGKTEGVYGALAPEMWQAGRYQEVIDYCIQDTRLTLQLAQAVIERGAAEWTSKSGKPQSVKVDRWLTVAEAVRLPEPDNSWMDKPWKRSKFVGWCGL